MIDNVTKTEIVDVGVVGVPVTDQDEALDFYLRQLGFECRVDTPIPNGGRWIMVAPTSATTAIALVAPREDNPAGVATGIRFTTSDAPADDTAIRDQGLDGGELLQSPGVPD